MDNRQLSNTIEISTDIGTYTYDINAVNAINAENAQKLGGVAASSYAKKSDLSSIPNQTVTANGVTFGDNVAVEFVGDGATSITSSGDSNQIKISSTDTKVTSVDNHYSPTEDTVQELSVDANSSTSATWGTTDLVTGINIKRDAKGHVTGVTVDSVQMPANPDTHNSHAIISGKKSDGTTDIKSTASSGDITLGNSGVLPGSYGPTTDVTLAGTNQVTVPNITVNSQGIVTSAASKTVKIPAVINDLTSTSEIDALSAKQGKELKKLIDDISTDLGNLGYGDMLTTKYDTNKDGKVNSADNADNADKLGNKAASEYALKTDLFSKSYNDLTDKPTIPTDTNQTVKTGTTTFGVNDVVEFVAGTNVSITGDATNKKITISATDTNTELTVTDKANTDTTDLIYAVTNLVEDGTKGHTIKPTYTGLPTKDYVDKIATGHVKYLGTVTALTGLSTTAGLGDFYRVQTAFDFGSETAHVGDILIATKDKPGQNTTDWDLIHTEVDSNTWVENKVNAAGYVTAPGTSNTNKVWKTDGSGNPGWRDDANVDTGATSVEVTGTGNAVTAATYSAATRKLTLTKGATYATKTEVDTLISHGTADPDASTQSQYYFKIN